MERHLIHRVGWLRAMVLGANDGIISTSALILGVAASDATRTAILTAGMAGLVAGAVSMGLGEYVSVRTQKDTEEADIAKEMWELENVPERELEELIGIYQHKGLSRDLARQVAIELTAKDALKTHLAEELGIHDKTKARPIQAAISSLLSFAVGASLPLITAAATGKDSRVLIVMVITVLALALLGFVSAKT
ncbi:MAG: VIT family protein, partial [Actinobacteria bacterium]|nr:VIT family protein [Actinomycetota bacterium]